MAQHTSAQTQADDLSLRGWKDAQQLAFEAGHVRGYAERAALLNRLREVIEAREESILDALSRDFGKPRLESWATEIGFVLAEIQFALKHLKSWMAPQKVGTPLLLQPSSSHIRMRPWGRCLIIGPWNYPFMLAVAPLVAALAAGNTVLLKPSELTPHTSALLSSLLAEVAGPEIIAVAQGVGHELVPRAIEEFAPDFIFFTGSSAAGKAVLEQAARSLIPCVLELGGKCPAIVDGSTPMGVTAKRLMLAKFLNAGQTCVAVDHILVQRSHHDELVQSLSDSLSAAYGVAPTASDDVAQMINGHHFSRVRELMQHGRIAWGGAVDEERRRIDPTLLVDVDLHSALMQQEIFGPLLPIVPYDSEQELLQLLKLSPDPLALYVFSTDSELVERLLARVRCGAMAVNNAAVHLANPELPFGGVGRSGHGRYHGRAGFDAFSYTTSVLQSSTWFDPDFKYAPYTERALGLLKKLF